MADRAPRAVMGKWNVNGRTFPLLIAIGVLNHIVLTGSRVTVSLYALSLGASPLVVGTLMGLYAFLPMLLAVGAGRLSDRIGARRPMLVGSCGIVVGILLPCALPGTAALYASTSLIGVSFMCFQVAMQHVTGSIGAHEDRPRNFGLLALGYSISSFAGPLIAGIMIDQVSFVATFALLAVFPLAPLFVLARNLLALPGPQPEHARMAPTSILELLANSHMRRIFIVNGLISVAWDLHSFFIPIYGASIGLSALRIGLILSVFAAATFTVRLFMPWIARRLSEFEVLTYALFVAGAAYALYPFASSPGVLMVLSFALGMSLGSAQPMVMSLLHSIAPPGKMGEAVGVRMSIVNASTFAVPLVFGAVGTGLGLGPVLWSVGAVLAGGGLFARRR
jgi:MFS family permease